MKRMQRAGVLAACLAAGTIGISQAEERNDFGKREYEANCAACHGLKGKGNGPYAGIVDTRIADLTILARANNGVFPFERVYGVIDGRDAVKAHGRRDMPVWGDHYLDASRDALLDVPYEPEAFVRTRLLAITDYVKRLQVTEQARTD